MPDRRAFLGILAVSALVLPRSAESQRAEKVARIGYLSSGSGTINAHLPQAFRDGLRELGWVEGKNLVIEYRFAEGKLDRLPELAAELLRLKPDVLAAGPSPPALAAKRATATVPIVMMSVGDPVGLGLVSSLARPGGNVTGTSFDVGLESFGKCLELLKQILPAAGRVAILINPGNPAQKLAINVLNDSARSLGVRLQTLEARSPGEFDAAFASIARERIPALLVVTDTIFIQNRARLVELAASQRLPLMSGAREFAEAGALVSYGPSLVEQFRRAATYVDKILRGANPAELPVEQPTKFELVINLETAKALGLAIPPALLNRADEVIQ